VLKQLIAMFFITVVSISANDDFKVKFNDEEVLTDCEKQLRTCQQKCDEIKDNKKDYIKCEDKCDEEFEICVAQEQ
jgi:hypothetical protein